MQNNKGQVAYFLEENISGKTLYLFEGWDLTGEEAALYVSQITTAEDGYLYLEGLNLGTYTLKEIEAPNGYNRLTNDITVTISAGGTEVDPIYSQPVISYTYNDTTGTGTVRVLNLEGTELPGTGGIGTTIFYIIGAVLVAGAVVVLVTRRRMTREG